MTDLERLYAVADDDEAGVLDRLQEKAGLVWTCHGPHRADQPGLWTNAAGTPCEVCGLRQGETVVRP